jgi:hypothetical protein
MMHPEAALNLSDAGRRTSCLGVHTFVTFFRGFLS